MLKTNIIVAIILLLSKVVANAQVTERSRPEAWNNLIYGGRFMDRFLFMPKLGRMTSDTWGAPSVIPRDINNGIEDSEWSYWGGNIRLLDDGKYHLFVCRWAENAEKGHFEWGNSFVEHAVSDNSFGPFKVVQELGKGHNPEWYITDNGKYIVYVIDGYYIADNVFGPWEYRQFNFDNRDRYIIEGLSNLTFAKREDGSFLMVCRGGGIWISEDGLSGWNQISDERVYPPVDGRFEDPLVWKTHVQYHLVVNDWLGRIAWHLRSKDGVRWKVDTGEAYLPGISIYEDGVKEEWFKYERIKVMQDEYGRPTQANFAVIDTFKWMDKPNDNHSSKLITIPLTIEKLMYVINKNKIDANTKEIKVFVKAEEGFNPFTDIDIETLRFGAPEVVDFGKGCKLKNIKKNDAGALLTFHGEGNGITEANFAAKLLGKTKEDKLLIAYSRLPEVAYIEPLISARKPIVDTINNKLTIDVENFGQVASSETTLHVFVKKGSTKNEIGSVELPVLQPYDRKTVGFNIPYNFLVNVDTAFFVVAMNEDKEEILFDPQKPLTPDESH